MNHHVIRMFWIIIETINSLISLFNTTIWRVLTKTNFQEFKARGLSFYKKIMLRKNETKGKITPLLRLFLTRCIDRGLEDIC